jgi:hypothetical protein
MASANPKHRTLKEKPSRIVLPFTEPAPAPPEPPNDLEQRPNPGSRLALAMWLIAFLFLCSLVLWDLVTAILFR